MSDKTFATARAPLALAGLALLAACFAAGCGDSPSQPTPPPTPLSRVVIGTGGDTLATRDTLTVGSVVQYSATPYDTAGVAAPGVDVDWASSNAGVFTVDGTGKITATGEGVALLIATASSVADTIEVLVLPATSGWFIQSSSTTSQLNGVFFQPDGRRGWAVGTAGTIVATTDAGQTWGAQVSNSSFNLNGVWFTGPNDGWVAGNSGTILHTTNGGTTWTRMTNTGTGLNLMDVYFATPDTGWAVGQNGVVLRTFDGGTNWSQQTLVGSQFNSIHFAGTRHGWIVGDNGQIWGTEDRGLNWDPEPSITSADLRAVWRRSYLVAEAGGSGGAAPRTVDNAGAPQWELRNAGASNDFYGVMFPTDLTGVAVGVNGTGIVLRTDDGGVNWSQQSPNVAGTLRAVYFVDELRGWAVGDGGRIIHTGTGGY